jgi:putative transcriptional regulator
VNERNDNGTHRVVSHLADLLDSRQMTLVQLATRTGITVANLSVLKNDHARAIRFTTLTAICDALGCQPGDVLAVHGSRATTPGRMTTIA